MLFHYYPTKSKVIMFILLPFIFLKKNETKIQGCQSKTISLFIFKLQN